jgi:hypothetical protein
MISLKSICGLLNLEESHSYKIIYSGILKGAVNGCKLLILLVGAGRFERPTPCAQVIGCPHLGINRFNNLRTLLVGPCGNFSYNLDCKAAIRLVKPPTIPTGSPAGSADCEINQRGRAYVVTAGSLEGPSIAGFKLGDPLLLRQVVVG